LALAVNVATNLRHPAQATREPQAPGL